MDLAESTFSSKRPDKALESAVCHMISLVFLTLGRECLSSYDTLFELIQVSSPTPVIALFARARAPDSPDYPPPCPVPLRCRHQHLHSIQKPAMLHMGGVTDAHLGLV